VKVEVGLGVAVGVDVRVGVGVRVGAGVDGAGREEVAVAWGAGVSVAAWAMMDVGDAGGSSGAPHPPRIRIGIRRKRGDALKRRRNGLTVRLPSQR